MTWSKSARRSLAMHTQTPLLPIDCMLFDLGNVVADIVKQREDKLLGGDIESFHESLFGLAHDHLPIGPSVVRRRSHGCEVVLAFGRLNRRTRQLAIRQRDPISGHRLVHYFE